MSTIALQNSAFSLLDKMRLVKLKRKAIRSGAWFKVLPRIDRVLFDLTIKVTRGNVRSASLAKEILVVIGKLGGLLESRLARAIKDIGFPLACKYSVLAQEWGNQRAKEWAEDVSFAQYLTIIYLNQRSCNG